ncbi:glyoxalase/bleomycin resistance protein/dioxygenase superfamily protein [Jatrophihabitans sp. GAS493]|uniref:VOC family protein n=1 Tax=Jatrophihabitans sp. GAS493 TaxID=1907575 RepID=UPI000BB83C82|nr:VOC family protein [Jatrophihabitans sp. GAS493]SOD74800.1 glyoxalase/bleomycin resistance protein/dioxygenase superfamily protein [Jatrophihabitans sp. GAS493]
MPPTDGLTLRQFVLDSTDARGLAEFYRLLLGIPYREGDERPDGAESSENGEDFIVLMNPAGGARLAFQQVEQLPEPTWPEGPIPQMGHLDLQVSSREALDAAHRRATSLGARLLRDLADDPQEPIRIYADLSGHPFCIFLASD